MCICEALITFSVWNLSHSRLHACFHPLLSLPTSQVKSELEGRAFTALVNTIEAGGSTSPMETQDLPYLKRLLETNTVGTLGLVQIFLPLIRYLLLLLIPSPIPLPPRSSYLQLSPSLPCCFTTLETGVLMPV